MINLQIRGDIDAIRQGDDAKYIPEDLLKLVKIFVSHAISYLDKVFAIEENQHATNPLTRIITAFHLSC